MMKSILKSVFAMLAVGMSISAYGQGETVFAYASKTDAQEASGTALHETYDVAIALSNPELAGKKITAIEVPVYPSQYISGLKVWIAHELKLELINGKNTNIVDKSYELEYPLEGGLQYVKYDLEEPYIIPEGGAFVGYSLTVNELKNFHPETYTPLQCATKGKAGGLYLHTSRSFLDWQDRSEMLGCVALTQVHIEGDFMLDAATIGSVGLKYIEAGTPQKVALPVYNVGLNEIHSLGYTATTSEGASVQGVVECEEPLPAVLAYSHNVEFELPAIENLGHCTATVVIDQVNGVENDNAEASIEFEIKALSFVPKHLAVVEEYTGTWCGWCSRGYIAMELMSEINPDFIGIAYHNLDPMEMVGGYPLLTTGAPSVTIDRVLDTDPFYAKGTSSGFKMPELYAEYCESFVPVGITLSAEYNSDGTVTVNSTTEWADQAAPGDYAIEYVLLADDVYDITGEGNPRNWAQHNYYSTEPSEPYLEWICSQPAYIYDLHFNDVAILTSGLKGVEGSIVDTTVGYANDHAYTFDTKKALSPIYNANGTVNHTVAIPFHPDKLRVVAMLLDRSDKSLLGSIYGKVVNAVKCDVAYDQGGISSVTVEGKTVEEVIYYNLSGIRVAQPVRGGLYIKSQRYSDGTTDGEVVKF